MKFELTEVWGFAHAVRGMRNAMESWELSDSGWNNVDHEFFIIGPADLNLMQNLIRAGSDHRKFMRQIMVSVDITAPLYYWKEFSTYKIGTVSNSTSTMHKLASTPITMDCFEKSNESASINDSFFVEHWLFTIATLEKLRKLYNETKDKRYWKELIRLLPESWLQKRTITMSYENIYNMYHQRKHHKLTEWSVEFVSWCKGLPYFEELIEVIK